MFTARSPTRSRSVLIFTAATIDRRSVAIGWCSASRRKQRSSTSMCSLLIGSSPRNTFSMRCVSRSTEAVHGLAHALFGQAPHFEQAALELLEFFPEMRYSTLH